LRGLAGIKFLLAAKLAQISEIPACATGNRAFVGTKKGEGGHLEFTLPGMLDNKSFLGMFRFNGTTVTIFSNCCLLTISIFKNNRDKDILSI
jgi:hypothetical protein